MNRDALPDIETPADVDRLVAEFYRTVLPDPIIGFIFTDIARIDLAAHLPVISAFWQQQLLGRPGYGGQTFAVHRQLHGQLPLTADHFHRWLHLFSAAVDRLFCGPRAEAAKQRAARIADSMRQALEQRYPSGSDVNEDGDVQYWQP